MTKKKLLLLFCFAVLCVTMIYARGKSEKDASAQSKPITIEFKTDYPPVNPGEVRSVQVTGIVRLVGTGLFNDLVISGEHEWYIASEDRDKLHQYQQQTVTVKGEETVQELKFANGMSAGIRRELRNIKIISVN